MTSGKTYLSAVCSWLSCSESATGSDMETENAMENEQNWTWYQWVFAVLLMGAIFYASVRFAIP
jgi:hypothetical protein